jgi:hypothetical protein
MYRRSMAVLAKRTVVRDPRKVKQNQLRPVPHVEEEAQSSVPAQQQPPLPIPPPQGHQPPSMGATLGFYVVAGVGVTLGFALVGAILG